MIGAVPREVIISLGFLEVLGSAALAGIVVALIAELFGLPSARPDRRPMSQTPDVRNWLIAASCLVTVVLIAVPAFANGFEWRLLWQAVALPLTILLLLVGWERLRAAGGARGVRVVFVWVVFTAVAVPNTMMSAALLRFQDVRLCVDGYEAPLNGKQIAVTPDIAVVTGLDIGPPRAIVTFPGDAVKRVDSGGLDAATTCPAP
ncbi:hypothetical protein [Solirubrobacter soli]|uniref:hypothetical protein n=1 Tax=Solirubrobacter soli TaxID=363832 RepID=UPI00041E3366|nr:hypothetical protein [Solirubrobacter soli]